MQPVERIVFRVLHIAVFVVGVTACAVLAVAKGHPPGLVFVPVAVAVWLAAHGFLFGLRRLLRRMAAPATGDTPGWPVPLALALLGSGAVIVMQLWAVLPALLFKREGADPRAWLMALVMLMPAGFLAGGIVYGYATGSRLARWISAAGPIGFATYIVVESVRRTVVTGRPEQAPLSLVTVAAGVALGVYLLRSEAVRAFFNSRFPTSRRRSRSRSSTASLRRRE